MADSDSDQPRRKRVLCVDDEEDILRLYETFLGFTDYDVVTVSSANACLDFLKADTADIMLLDVNMPGIDGLTLLEFIRANDRTASMRVVMITARRDEATVRRAAQLGCDSFVVKPFKLAELERRIALELVTLGEDELRDILKGALQMRTSVFREPGIGDYNAVNWDPYVVKHRNNSICILVPRGVRPFHFVRASREELELRVVVLFRHPQRWKKAWPLPKKADGETSAA